MLATTLSAIVTVIASSSEGGGSGFLLLLGPVAGGGAYFGLWSYYRNTGKSHAFERETRIQAQPVTGTDVKVGDIKGTKRSSIDGDNRNDHRARVERIP
jgi:hypothetical protein